MWVKAVLSREDLGALIHELLPLKISFSGNGRGERSLTLGAPRDVQLVAGTGLRVVCKALVSWPLLGVELPVALHTLSVLLRPVIAERDSHDVLAFQIQIEHADLAGLPAFFDAKITERVNKELSARRLALAWDFTRTLSHAFRLPATLEPVERLKLTATQGHVEIDEQQLSLTVSFRAHVERAKREVVV